MADLSRSEFGDFLRSRRAKLKPKSVGLPDGRRRRAPGLRREEVALLVQAVAPKPLNILTVPAMKLSVAELADLGVRRISVGGALARAAWGGFMRAAQEIAQQGSFNALADAASGAALDKFFGEDLERRKEPR